MQVVPVEQIRTPIPHIASRQTGETYWKESICREGEKRENIPPMRHSHDAGSRHSVCGNQLYYTVVGDKPSTSIRNSLIPIKDIVRTTLGKEVKH